MQTVEETPPGQDLVEPAEIMKLDSLVLHECDVQVATAHRFPRSIKRCQQQILDLATLDKETAEQMYYEFPRGKGRDRKIITGPSIHFAKIVSLAWQHLRVGGSVVRVEEKNVICRGICWDLQQNVAWQTEVPRKILYSDGRRYSEDMITVTSLACISIAQRNALFKVVPEPLWRAAYRQTRLVAAGKEEGLQARRKVMIEWFKAKKIGPDALLQIIGVPEWEAVGVEQVAQMRAIAQAIEDKEITVKELLADVASAANQVDFAGPRSLKDELKSRRDASKAPEGAEPPTEGPKPKEGTPEGSGEAVTED